MGKVSRWCLLTCFGLAGCASITAGPELPRPAQAAGAVTLAAPDPTTTTTMDPAEAMATQCPTELCLVYSLRRGAVWSDGTPVTVDDFIRTASYMAAPLSGAPDIYQSIVAIEPIDGERFRVSLTGEFGDWPQLFQRVLPPGYGGGDIGDHPGTGPFVIVEQIADVRLVLARNRSFWSDSEPISGAPVGTVEEIVFVYIPDQDELVEALEDGLVDVVSTRATPELLDELEGLEGFQMKISPGPFWEHIDFHHEDPLLSQPWVREVFALAIDREKALDRTLRLVDPAASALDNSVYMQGTEHHEPHYARSHDPARAEQILVENGCERAGVVYVCDGQEMSFRWSSTNDDPMRDELFDSVREDLAAVGIELVPDFIAPSAFVNRDFLFGGPETWQLLNFSWRATDDPSSVASTYLCDDTGLNVNRYCSETVDGRIRSTFAIGDQIQRAAAFNEADRAYLDDLAIIPLYQKPNLLVWASELTGPAPNWSQQSDLWNVAAWTGPTSIVVALDHEPSLDPLASGDDAANAALSALLYGATGMDPSHHRVPVLVDSIDVVEG